MKTAKLSTFASTTEEVTAAINAGAKKLILEDAKLCTRCQNQQDYSIPHFEKLSLLAQGARKLDPTIELSANCDVLIHHYHLAQIDELVSAMQKASINELRVQDPGLQVYLAEKHPTIHCHLTTETGNLNKLSLRYLADQFASQSLNHELPYQDIQEIQAHFKATNKPNYPFEIQVQGPILLQYSHRRYMAGRLTHTGEKELTPDSPELIKKLAKDHDHPDRRFPFVDNPHGHFMFLHFDRCLLRQYDKLKSLELDYWLIDARGHSLDYLTTALTAYKTGDTTLISELEALANKKQLLGFFLSNKTDYELRKTIRMEEKHNLGTLKAVIIDYAKGKWCTLEVKHPFSTQDTSQILTQENKLFPISDLQLRDLEDKPLTTTANHRLVKVKWHKGMQPKALIY